MTDEQQYSIAGGNNQIAPHAMHITQNNIYIGDDHSSVKQPSFDIKCYVSHDAVGVIDFIREAQKHVVLHAAYYPKYAHDEKGAEIEKKLKSNADFTLTVIYTSTKETPWLPEFVKVLRGYFSKDTFKKELKADLEYFRRLQADYPKQVKIIPCSRLPLFPVVLVDNTIVVGHYAHSTTIAPCGLWFSIYHPRIGEIYDMVCLHKPLGGVFNSPDQLAILRYIEELALTEAKLGNGVCQTTDIPEEKANTTSMET